MAKLVADGPGRALDVVHRRDELLAGKDDHARQRLERVARQRIEPRDAVDLVAEKLDTDPLLQFRRANLDRVAAHAKMATLKLDVIALVLNFHEARKEPFASKRLAGAKSDDHLLEVALFANSVDARNAGDDDHVAPGQERTHRREAQPLDLVVDARVLLNEGVGLRDVRLWLVIVEVTDEILNGVIREKTLELGVQLGGQGLVV